MRKIIFSLFIFSLFFTVSAIAGNEKVKQAQHEVNLEKLVDKMNSTCGSTISVQIDWDSFSGSDWQKMSVYSYCGTIVKSLSDFCSYEKGNSQAYIKKNIKPIICSYSKAEDYSLIIDKDVIHHNINFKMKNLDDAVRAQLLKKL